MHSFANGLLINSDGILTGIGTITPTAGGITANASAQIAPGPVGTVGTLVIDLGTTSGNMTMVSGSKFLFDLNATSVTSDLLSLTNGSAGDLVFGGNAIDFSVLSGSLSNGQVYTLFSATAANNFSGLTFDGAKITGGLSIGSGLTGFESSYLSLNGSNIQLNVIPEPSTALLLGMGTLAFAAFRNRRRS